MKKTVCFIIISLMIFSSLTISAFTENIDASANVSAVLLRAGGGGGSGGGGGGGSNSGGGNGSFSTHSDTEQPPTLFESIIQFVTMPFVLFSSSIIFYIKLTKRSRKSRKLMKQMMQSDNAWKFKDISSTVSESFYAIQTAWSNMDMTPASEYMSDKLYNSFQTKLNWMAYRNQKNVLENIMLLQASPVAIYDDTDNSRDYIWFYIKGKMVDYIIDTDTQSKISGNTSSASFVEYWQFTRKENSWVLNEILQKDEADQIPFNE